MPAETTTVRLPRRLHKELKIAAAQSDSSMQAFMEQLFARHRAETEQQRGPLLAESASEFGELRPEERRLVRALVRLMRDESNPARETLLRIIAAAVEPVSVSGAKRSKRRDTRAKLG